MFILKVYLKFIIDTAGKIRDIEIVRKLGWGFDEEAIRVFKLMPDWIPGKQNGKAVKVRLIYPIIFEFNRD